MKRLVKQILSVIAIATITTTMITVCGNDNKKTANRLEQIKQKGEITVATEPYFAPQEFIDPSKQGQEQYVGSDIEMAKYIAEKLGVKLKIVPLEFTAVIGSVAEGKYDLAISALGYTPERANAMELSKGYSFDGEDGGYGLIIRNEFKDKIKTKEDTKDYIMVTQSGSLQEMIINTQIKENKELKKVSSMDEVFLSIKEKKVDVAVVDLNNAGLYLKNNPDSNMMIVENYKIELPEEYKGTRVGAPNGEKELIDFVNGCIDELVASGQYEKWVKEYAKYANKLGL